MSIVKIDPVKAAPKLEDYENAIQNIVEQVAKSKGYRDANTLVSYAVSTNATWAAEATNFVAWRDAVWLYVNQKLQKFQNGSRAQPTVEGFVTELPVIEWPE